MQGLQSVYEKGVRFPFVYSVSTGSIAASGSATRTLVMDADSQFQLSRFAAWSSLGADTDVDPDNFTVTITLNSTGRRLMNEAVHQRIIAPTQYPNNLFNNIIFAPQDSLLFEFTNTDSGNAQSIQFSLLGFKIFRGI